MRYDRLKMGFGFTRGQRSKPPLIVSHSGGGEMLGDETRVVYSIDDELAEASVSRQRIPLKADFSVTRDL